MCYLSRVDVYYVVSLHGIKSTQISYSVNRSSRSNLLGLRAHIDHVVLLDTVLQAEIFYQSNNIKYSGMFIT